MVSCAKKKLNDIGKPVKSLASKEKEGGKIEIQKRKKKKIKNKK